MLTKNKPPEGTEYGDIDASFDFLNEQGFDRDSSILEIGCNAGSLTKKLVDAGYRNIVATDVNAKHIDHCRQKHPELTDSFEVADGAALPFPEKRFDLVVSFDVIEHIPDVNRHFREVNRVLKDNGHYVFQTPNKLVNVPWEIAFHNSLRGWKNYHSSLQTHHSLKKLVNDSDFKIVLIQKSKQLTAHKIRKAQKRFGVFGKTIARIVFAMPLSFSPNFWCNIQKTNNQ